jgi:hypothetical protein
MLPREDLTSAEKEIADLVAALAKTGNLHPLIALLRDGHVGPERARDALRLLGELDPDLLVQVALDTLISDYLDDPGLALQSRRELRGQDRAGDA